MCVDLLLVLASRHMLLCSIRAVTAEAFQGMQGDSVLHKNRKEVIREILYKAFTLFLCCLLAIRLCLPLACGVNIQTLAVMHPWHYLAKTGACWSARAGHSGPRGWVTAATLCTRTMSPSAAFVQVVFIQLQLDGKPRMIYSSLSTVSFVSAEPKSKQFWKYPRSF